MDEPTIATMAERLERLEDRYRRVKRAGILVGLFGGLSLLVMGIAGARLAQNEVEASRFLVRDAQGNVRIDLGINSDADAAYLHIFDKNRKSTVDLSNLKYAELNNQNHSVLCISDSDGPGRVVVQSLGGEPSLVMYDRDGNVTFRAP